MGEVQSFESVLGLVDVGCLREVKSFESGLERVLVGGWE